MIGLARGGLQLDESVVPLYAASVHYWRLDRQDWKPCLAAVKALGARFVDIYVPWGVHEVEADRLELGESDPQRDVAGFLRIAHELGLLAIVRPGPHINAELTYFGLPERIVWDPACQARSPKGNPVVLPMVPKMFPVPSYASTAFLDEVTRYFHLLGAKLAPLCHPAGPIALLQIDNEGAFYFRDGAYDQDYHPDAIALYRSFLRDKYGSALPYGEVRFSDVEPPLRFDATTSAELPYHLDWVQFQEHLLAQAFGRFASALRGAGFASVPTMHNFPLAEHTTPLNAARVSDAVDMVGLDYYGPANERARAEVARRTSGLALRSDGLDVPAFACEMGAGFPPFFPPLSETDSIFTVMTALAYGLRGFNIYMAVERDRWIGSPIDEYGNARPFAKFWTKLITALDACEFHRLSRHAPVRLVVPRVEQRLGRVLHGFGPVSGAVLSVMGHGAREGAAEVAIEGCDEALVVPAQEFARAVERALDLRGVPYALVGGEDRSVSLPGARWIICATSGAIGPSLRASLDGMASQGARVTLGPVAPAYDDAFRPLDAPMSGCDVLETSQARLVDAAVAQGIDTLGIACHPCVPTSVHLTLHHDSEGLVRVAFLLNGSAQRADVSANIGVDATWTDMFDGSSHTSVNGSLELPIRAQQVRMLARDGSTR